MSASVICPGCGRPVRMSAGVVLRRARCSKCRARLLAPRPDRPRPKAPDRQRAVAPEAPAAETLDESAGRSVPPPPVPPAPGDEPRPRRWPAVAGVVVAALALVAFGAVAYRAGVRDATPPPAEVGSIDPAAAPPGVSAPGSPLPESPSHLDLVYRTGSARLDDGPAEVTALALSPIDGSVLVGYADGSCRVWSLDQPAFEAPRPGPRADGPVRRITLDPAGRVVYLHTDRGLTAAALRNPPRHPVVLPGDPAAVFFEPDRDRFAAVHDGRVRVRYLPLGLIAAPPPARAVGGFVRSAPQDEVIPLGVPPAPAPLPGRPTFLAWHPAGRVLCGMPDGTIRTWNGAGPQSTVVSREHRAAVRAWASARGDLATGDDAGVVGYWPNKSAFPIPFRAADAPVRHLAFAPCSGDLLVVDAAGGVAVWDPAGGVKRWGLRRPGPVAAAAFGPADDVVLLADGRAVEVVWLARP